MRVPPNVAAAERSAREAGFSMSCAPETGRLLAALAAAVPTGGRILEMGTGYGVGLGWIVSGLGARRDVTVVSVEADLVTAQSARSHPWPQCVDLRDGDALDVLSEFDGFDLIFADAQGGKWFGLDRTIAAVRPRGVLFVDDMDLDALTGDDRARQTAVRNVLLEHLELTVAELTAGTACIIAVRNG